MNRLINNNYNGEEIQIIKIDNGEFWYQDANNSVQLGSLLEDQVIVRRTAFDLQASPENQKKHTNDTMTAFRRWGQVQGIKVAPENNDIIEIIRSNEKVIISRQKIPDKNVVPPSNYNSQGLKLALENLESTSSTGECRTLTRRALIFVIYTILIISAVLVIVKFVPGISSF